MPTKPQVGITSSTSQAARRYLDTFFDQHKDTAAGFPNGRPWWGYREYAAMRGTDDGFVGADLCKGHHEDPSLAWNAPFVPERMFFDLDYRHARITINYRKMLAHDRIGYDRYYEAANKIAHEKSWKELEYGALPPFPVRSILGDPPRNPKIAQAFMAGDRWLLGFSREVNVELAQLLGLNAQGWKVVREPIAPVLSPEGVISLTRDELRALVREEAEKLATEKPRRKHRRTRPLPIDVPAPSAA